MKISLFHADFRDPMHNLTVPVGRYKNSAPLNQGFKQVFHDRFSSLLAETLSFWERCDALMAAGAILDC